MCANVREWGIAVWAILALMCFGVSASAQEIQQLKGTVIGTAQSVDYNTNSASTTVNTRDMAFDGNLDTYFASYDRSNTWVGLDLGTPHVITKVRWSPRKESSHGPKRVRLAVFEGANREDFLDAVPLYVVDALGTIGKYDEANVDVSRAFRYVRYVGPNDARCNVAEVEFYGYEGEGDDTHFYQVTNLPTVSIHTVDNQEPYDKENEIDCQAFIVYEDGTLTQEYPMLIRLRGNASKNFPKKPYRIKFNDGKKHHMLHGGELEAPAKAKKWTLINNYGDKTLMRNVIAFELSRRLGMAYTPYCQPVDVILNGEYKGCYQLCDQVEVGNGRVDITKMSQSDTQSPALTGGYFTEVDAYYTDEPMYIVTSSYNNPVVIKSPESDSIVSAQKTYVRNYFNMMETRLKASDFTSRSENYRKVFDITSFLQHFLVGEFSGNTDTYWSTYIYKDRDDDLLRVGPVWDFDLAFENDNRTYPINNLSGYIYATNGSYAGDMRTMVSRILSDGTVKRALYDMWVDARRQRGFNEESLIAYVDSVAEELDASQRLNFMRWDILNSYVHQNPRVLGSYEAEVEGVKTYIRERLAWFDKKLGYDASTDGIYTASRKEKDDAIYDLGGRRIHQGESLRAGIYIRNGYKVMLGE